jgi:hypothetical protein
VEELFHSFDEVVRIDCVLFRHYFLDRCATDTTEFVVFVE